MHDARLAGRENVWRYKDEKRVCTYTVPLGWVYAHTIPWDGSTHTLYPGIALYGMYIQVGLPRYIVCPVRRRACSLQGSPWRVPEDLLEDLRPRYPLGSRAAHSRSAVRAILEVLTMLIACTGTRYSDDQTCSDLCFTLSATRPRPSSDAPRRERESQEMVRCSPSCE